MAFERNCSSLLSSASHIFMKNFAFYPSKDLESIRYFPRHIKILLAKKFLASRAYTANIEWKYFIQFFLCENLLEADLTLYDVDDEVLELLEVCKGLKLLHIQKRKDETGVITPEALWWALPNFTELTDLKITNCEGVTDDVVIAIVNSCPKIKKLCLQNCKNVTDVGLDAISATKCIGIDLSGTMITTEGLRRFADTDLAKNIEDLRIQNCIHVVKYGLMVEIVQKCSSLVNFCVDGRPIRSEDMNFWCQADNLKHLKQINWTIEW